MYIVCFFTVADGGRQSVWNIPHLQSGLELVKTLDPYDDSTVKITPCEWALLLV